MRNQGRQITGDMIPHIESHQVEQTKRGGLRSPNQGTGNRIYLIYGIAILQNEVQGKRACTECNAIANEIRRVLTKDNSFAETVFAKPGDKLDDFFIGICCGANLQQLQIARRIKEMCAKKMLLK